MNELDRLLAQADGSPCYGVVGNPVAHSLSPRIHRLFSEQVNALLYYGKLLVETERFPETVECFFGRGGQGLNVTVPFKEEAFQLCQRTTNRAQAAGAVNTLWKEGTMLCGDNTDGVGLVADLSGRCRIDLDHKRILILGAGGAVKGVIEPLFNAGVGCIAICNRTLEKAQSVVRHFEVFGAMNLLPVGQASADPFDLVINATAASLYGKVPAMHSSWLAENTQAYDMVYSDKQTPFLVEMANRGVQEGWDGLGMLVEQAAEAFYLWLGKRPQTQPVFAQLSESLIKRRS